MALMNISKEIVIDHQDIMYFLSSEFNYFKNVGVNHEVNSYTFEILGRGVPSNKIYIDVELDVKSTGVFSLRGWKYFFNKKLTVFDDWNRPYEDGKLIKFTPKLKYVVLTLWQPYATLLVEGVKQYETRPMKTNFLSSRNFRILIHAARKWDKEITSKIWRYPFYQELGSLEYIQENNGEPECNLPIGQIIGSIDVVSCDDITRIYGQNIIVNGNELRKISVNEIEMGIYLPGRKMWVTKNPKKYSKPIPYKGQQGIRPYKGDIKQILRYESE